MRRRFVCLMACLLALSAAGCAPSPALPADLGQLVTKLNAAVSAHDETTFKTLTNGETATGIRGWVWVNLGQLSQVTFKAGRSGSLWADWRLPGDIQPISSQVGTTSCADNGCRVASLEPQSDRPAPIWLVQPLQILGDDTAILLASTSTPPADAQSWASAGQAAQQAVAGVDLGDLASWNGNLTVELPQNALAFAQVLGLASSADYASTGAVTQIEGAADSSQYPVAHIVVNPQTTANLTLDQQTLLLTHEGVHVATSGTPVAPGATWVSEGLAESVAVAVSPSTAADEQALAKASCNDGLTPPTDAAFGGTDATAQNTAYAVSQVLVGLIRSHLGAGAMTAISQLWQGQESPQVDLAAWSQAWCAS
ncbi:MAG: hypothetical protein FWD63_08885 [Propionibacteriaceae bacterium]|nr:hypothetical protein [Propionibacteriaceae bacterium]